MFSANENLLLRKHKRKIVDFVEACIPEDVLDLGTNVMVMQVSCKAPGCVPLETAVIIVFPKSTRELIIGLPESQGGSFKTKILKPMSEVTKEDVLEALPPEFPGGLRSMTKLCLAARDVALAQITQLFGDDDLEGRKLMAEYLQQSLQQYIDRECVPPPLGEPFEELAGSADSKSVQQGSTSNETSAPTTTTSTAVAPATRIAKGTGNVVIRRPVDNDTETNTTAPSTMAAKGQVPTSQPRLSSRSSAAATKPTIVSSVASQRQQQAADRLLNSSTQQQSSLLARLGEREHAPGIRRPGCPCCDPDNPANVVDQMMQL